MKTKIFLLQVESIGLPLIACYDKSKLDACKTRLMKIVNKYHSNFLNAKEKETDELMILRIQCSLYISEEIGCDSSKEIAKIIKACENFSEKSKSWWDDATNPLEISVCEIPYMAQEISAKSYETHCDNIANYEHLESKKNCICSGEKKLHHD